MDRLSLGYGAFAPCSEAKQLLSFVNPTMCIFSVRKKATKSKLRVTCPIRVDTLPVVIETTTDPRYSVWATFEVQSC